MHAAILCGILKDGALLVPLSKAEVRLVRSIIVSSILSTDMRYHFTQVADLKMFRNAYCMDSKANFEEPGKNHRRFFMDLIVHAADVSNACKEWNISRSWSLLIQDEFYKQGDHEREIQLASVPAMFDRHSNSMEMGQINFIEHLVLPLFSTLKDIFPATLELYEHATINMAKWSDKYELRQTNLSREEVDELHSRRKVKRRSTNTGEKQKSMKDQKLHNQSLEKAMSKLF